MSDIWYSPERFGLELVGYVDFSSGMYEFDYSAVWYRAADDAWFYGTDSGCSCPSPFDGRGVESLELLYPPLHALDAKLKARYVPVDPNDRWTNGEKMPAIIDLLERVAARCQ